MADIQAAFQLRILRQRHEPTVPLTVDMERAMREGFYQCRRCHGVVTFVNAEGARQCARCHGFALKFHAGIDA